MDKNKQENNINSRKRETSNPSSYQLGNRVEICTNCGGNGHTFRQCIAPVTSYGVIMVRSAKRGFSIEQTLANHQGTVTGMENQGLEYLLIQRRDSLGFIELIRGKYKVSDVPYIRLHLAGITEEERQKYKEGPFDKIWNGLWGMDHTHLYRNEYEIAKTKWHTIQKGVVDTNGKQWTLDEIINSAGPAQKSPEWGFPKGRRDCQESDFTCAMREMYEETGVRDSDVIPIQNLEPLTESFFGTNHVHYCHKYYIVWVPDRVTIEYNNDNATMLREIGDLKWFSLEEALGKIRPENIEKREVLLRAASLFRNLCPFPVGISKR